MRLHLQILLTAVILIRSNVNGYNLSDYRLPKYAVPSFNYFSVDLRNPEANTFNAKAWIQVTLPEPVTELVLNVDPNYVDIKSLGVDMGSASFVCSPGNYSAETQEMVLFCLEDLDDEIITASQPNDTTAMFRIDYTANFSDEPMGLYKNKFKVNNSASYVIYTQFEPTYLRRVFPSFDEPNIKAPVRVGVANNKNLTVVSNMDYAENYGFMDTPNMSTYLVAIVAGPNETWTTYRLSETYQFNFSVFAQRIHADYVWFALENGPHLMHLMGTYTDLPYETLGISKMTFAALPGMSGAMANWGLITFGEALLLDEGDRTPHRSTISLLTKMAHEIAHQWFGNYVTHNWWSELWLNEGFATYFEWYLSNLVETQYEYDKLFLINVLQPALQADGPNMVPLSNEESKVNTPQEIEDAFSNNAINSNKGASFIRMIRHALGEEVFQRAIQTYLKDNALKNVEASNLVDHLQAALPNTTDVNLTLYLNSWIYEPGYPILKTSIGATKSGSLIVSIDIYTFQPSLNNTDREESKWWVPVTYATSDEPFWDNATTFWINPGRTFGYFIQDINDSWGVLNVHASGYYRVDYDTDSLARIFRVLNNADTYTQIPVLNRAQLIDDLFNIAKYYVERQEGYKDRPYENAFSFVQYLKHEEEYLPWHTFLKEVQYLLNNLEDETTLKTLKADVLELIEAKLDFPNGTVIPLVSPLVILRSNLLLDWACKLGHEGAIEYVKGKFDMYKTDPKSIDNDYRDTIICYGVQNSNSPNTDYDTLMDIHAKSSIPQEQQEILIGLTCFSNADILDKYLATTLEDDPPIAKHFWPDIFNALCQRGPVGLEAAVRFIVKNSNAIIQKWKKPMDIHKMIKSVSEKIIKKEHAALLSNLLSTFSKDSDVGHDVVMALAEAEAHVKWLEKFGDEITSVLVYNGSPIPGPTTPSNGNNSARKLNSFTGIVLIIVSSIVFRCFV
ncbi:unnamed protein product [Ceutorhynchus assimilis]|uniref:Aminopeptidase n=1 Tax=Ceutorhynchus assimilis TaxID=467358 RepID=A0A9N9MUC3_9CUCU|nr:unnamed protein product [Ceutorhynchus assimilis]